MYSSSSSSTTSVRACYMVGQDHGLATLTDIDLRHRSTNGFVSRSTMGYATSSSPRSAAAAARFYDSRFEDQQPHFLQACSLCNKPLGGNRDIFMYRGDTPFCSEECRGEQIEIDEAKEKNKNFSSSVKALRKKEQRKSTSPNKAQRGGGYSFRTGAVAAA